MCTCMSWINVDLSGPTVVQHMPSRPFVAHPQNSLVPRRLKSRGSSKHGKEAKARIAASHVILTTRYFNLMFVYNPPLFGEGGTTNFLVPN